MLARLYGLTAGLLTLLLMPLVSIAAGDTPPEPYRPPIYRSAYPIITPDNVDRLTPVATLSRDGGNNYYDALARPVWSPNGQHLAAIGTGGEIGLRSRGLWLYDANDFFRPPQILEHANVINQVFSLDGAWIASISDPGYVGGKILFWDIRSGQHYNFQSNLYLLNISFSPDKNNVLFLTERVLRVWDTVTHEEIIAVPNTCGFDFNPTLSIVAMGGCGFPAVLSYYDIGRRHQVFVGEQDNSIVDVDINPVRQLLATTDAYNGTITIWGLLPDMSKIILDSSEYYPVYPPLIEFSPVGTSLASWNSTGDTIHLWSVETGRHVAALAGHAVPGSTGPGGSSLGVEFTPNGDLLVSSWPDNGATEDRNSRIWDTRNGDLLLTLPDELDATFSPDGTMLATDSTDGSIKIWAVQR